MEIEINLSPWREQRKQYQAKILKRFLIMPILCSLLVSVVMHAIVSAKIEVLHEHVGALQKETLGFAIQQRELNERNKRLNSMQRLAQILLQYQLVTDNLIAELIKTPIKNVCFTAIVREKNVIVFSGYTRSVADLTEFLIHWPANNLFAEMKVTNLHKQVENHAIRFQLQANEKKHLSLSLLDAQKVANDAI